jgi:hypothetical protein
MLIPYILIKAHPNSNYQEGNMSSSCDSVEESNLQKHFIEIISDDMYEFCSKKYGHDIEITSYDNFCYHYWDKHEYKMYCPIFEIHYFINNKWEEWLIHDYENELYQACLNKYKSESS